MEGCLYYHLGYLEPLTDEAQTGWREICNWVLDSSELAERANYDYLNREITDAVSLIVYVRYGKSYLKDEWSHAPLFSDITDKWVSVIGHNPHAYSYLITMLNGPGWTFAPEPALEWLSRIVKAHTDIGKLWCERDNGVRTAELLSRMWKNMDDQIRRDTASLKRYADLIDRLVATGVPLASRLQQQLEKRDL